MHSLIHLLIRLLIPRTIQGTPDRLYKPKVLVSKEPVQSSSTTGKIAQPNSMDMCLVGSGFSIDRAYLVRFVNTVTGGITCSAYFNTSKPSMMNKSSCGNVLGGAGAR